MGVLVMRTTGGDGGRVKIMVYILIWVVGVVCALGANMYPCTL